MKSIRSLASGAFIISVAVLAIVSILGIWNFLDKNVLSKSFETLGILALVAIIVVAASRFINSTTDVVDTSVVPKSVFTATRNITLGVLIISAVLLAFLGILSIWNVITNHTVLSRSLSSLMILIFSSMVIVMTALAQEENDLWRQQKRKIVWTSILIFLILTFILINSVFWV